MAAKVSIRMPGEKRWEPVANGATIRGGTWMAVCDAVNYLLGGTSRTLIPHSYVGMTDGGTFTLRYKIWPSYQATHRIWMLGLYSTAGENFTFTDPSGGSSTWSIFGAQTRQHVETISSRTSAVTTLAMSLTGTDDTHLQSLACFEIVRPSLAVDANDYGAELTSFYGTTPIYDGTGQSLGCLHDSITTALALRRTLFQWAATTVDAIAVTSGSAIPVLSYDVPLLDRQLYRNETQVGVTVWVYTRSGAGTTGEVIFTMTSGGTLTISITAADSGTWRTGTLNVDAEDLSTLDGRRSARFDQCAITARRTAGANSIFVDSISIAGRAT